MDLLDPSETTRYNYLRAALRLLRAEVRRRDFFAVVLRAAFFERRFFAIKYISFLFVGFC